MLIKNIKKQQGIIDIIMLFALLMLIIVTALTLYSTVREELNNSKLNLLALTYSISISQSKEDHVILLYDEIAPFQKNVLTTHHCTDVVVCQLFDIHRIPPNSYIDISYINGHFSSFRLHSKTTKTVFIMDLRVPSFVSLFPYGPKKENLSSSDDIKILTDLLQDITIYNQMDQTREQFKINERCNSIDCSSIFEYKVKQVL